MIKTGVTECDWVFFAGPHYICGKKIFAAQLLDNSIRLQIPTLRALYTLNRLPSRHLRDSGCRRVCVGLLGKIEWE